MSHANRLNRRDVVRPLVSSPLGDVLMWCNRLCMRWLDLRPVEGIIRAEGNGYIINSTLVRGLGSLALFIYDKNRHDPTDLWAPTHAAGTLVFGILPTYPNLKTPELEVTPRAKLLELFGS